MKTQLLAIFMMLCVAGYSQSALTGRITDEQDQPLPGVNILIKGTTKGTVTDANGQYAIEGVPGDAVLIISFIGYATQEIPVGSNTSIDAKLVPDAKMLQEVVAVGYGMRTMKEVTGAVALVTSDEIAKINPVRLDQALQGQSAGVMISPTSGSPGAGWIIRIRGLTTNGNNNPLLLVDGVPYSTDGLNALNPADIESVSVLKDATAGIYGVQSGNGVILVTTKQGKRNARPTIEFSGYYGVQEVSKKLNLLDAHEFAVLKNEAFAAGGQTPPYGNVNLGSGTDWQDHLFESAPIRNYSVSVNGGGDKSTYSIGGSYLEQEGIIGGPKSFYRRYNGRANFRNDILKNLKLESVFLYANENRRTIAEMGISSPLFNAINANPISSPYNTDGSFSYLEDVAEVVNPLAQIANTFNDTKVNKITGKEELTYNISKSFELTGRAGYNYAIVDDKFFNPLVYYGAGKAMNTALNGNLDPRMTEIAPGVSVPILSSVTEVRSTYFNYNLELFLNFNRTINENHNVKATLGTGSYGDVNSSVSGTGFNVPYNSWEFADISATDGNNLLNSTGSWQTKGLMQSVFLRGEYAFKSKYLLSAIIRRDAASNFGANKRYGWFPAFSAAWLLSEESFFQSSWIEMAKLRVSYGEAGNNKIPYNRFRALLGGEAVYPFNDQLTNGSAIGVLGNQDLKWENNIQTNIGIDLNLMNGKVNFTTDYYIKKTEDLLFTPDISAISGAYGPGGSPPYVNGGDIKNSGFEFSLAYRGKVAKDFDVSVSYNLTTIKNEVTSLPPGVDFYSFGGFGVGGSSASRMEVGYPMGYFYGFKTEGVYQTAEEVASRGVTQSLAQPGDLRYADLNNDGVISFGNNSDKTIIGSPIPDVTMGINLSVSYKGFDLYAMGYASIGNEILRNYERQQPLANILAYRINRWTGPGSTNEHPGLTTGLNNNAVISEYYVEDGSFFRVRNIQLGYSLPSSLVRKFGATKFRIYVAGNNLFTFTKYRGYDPDFSSGSPTTAGIDTGYYPQAKTMMVGLNLNF